MSSRRYPPRLPFNSNGYGPSGIIDEPFAVLSVQLGYLSSITVFSHQEIQHILRISLTRCFKRSYLNALEGLSPRASQFENV